MCVPIYRRDRRSRIQLIIANLSLVAGLILWVFVRPSFAEPHAWLDAACGLFMGISIAGNLFAARRCAGKPFSLNGSE